MQNIAIKRYFLIMNKKDVLGGFGCCRERPKNEKCTPTA
nr:MAG TPA: Pelovaterin [Caudoviricetes sp.]